MVDVQEGELVGLLAQDEEERVHEFNQLGNVVPPEGCCYLCGGEGGGEGKMVLLSFCFKE